MKAVQAEREGPELLPCFCGVHVPTVEVMKHHTRLLETMINGATKDMYRVG